MKFVVLVALVGFAVAQPVSEASVPSVTLPEGVSLPVTLPSTDIVTQLFSEIVALLQQLAGSGVTLPAGVTLPGGITVPDVTLPSEGARKKRQADGITAPVGVTLPEGITLPSGVTAPGLVSSLLSTIDSLLAVLNGGSSAVTLPAGITLPAGVTVPSA